MLTVVRDMTALLLIDLLLSFGHCMGYPTVKSDGELLESLCSSWTFRPLQCLLQSDWEESVVGVQS